jgi:hypothetical protein
MREMKANLMATLILGDGMEMGYFANVSEENSASILWVNPEDGSRMALQNARQMPCVAWYRNQKSATQSSSMLRTQCASTVQMYRYSCPCTTGRTTKYTRFLK